MRAMASTRSTISSKAIALPGMPNSREVSWSWAITSPPSRLTAAARAVP
jgi:hypothetical protein